MNLYRILLVDDEEEVRKSIIKKIGWQDAGFQVVGDAENGEDALEKIEQLEPDLVLTDIRMPYMDGLMLAEKIRQKYPSMKIIIFSGYDDFEYAKMAIKLNVTEYILKPVNVEELTAILNKIKRNLDEEIKQKRDVNRLRENYKNSLPVLREHFLNDLMKEEMEEELVDRKLSEYGENMAGAEKYIGVIIDLEDINSMENETNSLHQEKQLIPFSVKQLVEENLKNYGRFLMFNASADSNVAVIFAVDSKNTKTGLIAVLGDICKATKKILEVSITMGIGTSVTEISRISRSFHAAENALGYKAIVGAGGTIYINDVEPMNVGRLMFEERDQAELIAAVKFGQRERIEEAVNRLMEKMEDAKVHFHQYQAYQLNIINTIIQLVQQQEMDFSEVFEGEGSYLEVLSKPQKKEEFGQWLLQTAIRINQLMSRERANTAKTIIQEAKQYIHENYQNPDLSVEMICRHLHMSQAYFSTIFKKETGQAYTAYLTDVRLNKAVELLNETDDKTYIIAAKVGYQEQNYFSYVFKKRFGISPTKYRGAKK